MNTLLKNKPEIVFEVRTTYNVIDITAKSEKISVIVISRTPLFPDIKPNFYRRGRLVHAVSKV